MAFHQTKSKRQLHNGKNKKEFIFSNNITFYREFIFIFPWKINFKRYVITSDK